MNYGQTCSAPAAHGAFPTALLNARLSVRSAARWCNVPGFAAEILGGFAWVAAQSPADAKRLASLGAHCVDAPGNLKTAAPDLPVDDAELARLRAVLGGQPAWLAASTHPGDEACAARGAPGLVPRPSGADHHHRAAPSRAGTGDRGRAWRCASPGRRRRPGAGIWLADTLGELGLFYRLFPIVFIGKSFTPGGGQNPLEPARLGCAIAAGPAMQNFAQTTASLAASGGMETVEDEVALTHWVDRMLRDEAARRAMGQAARSAASGEADLPARMAARLVALMGA